MDNYDVSQNRMILDKLLDSGTIDEQETSKNSDIIVNLIGF